MQPPEQERTAAEKLKIHQSFVSETRELNDGIQNREALRLAFSNDYPIGLTVQLSPV